MVGWNEEWKGGDMSSIGGGYKVNLLKKELEKYKDDHDTIVMYVDR